jgi:transaldolase
MLQKFNDHKTIKLNNVMIPNKLKKIGDFGQSIWLDFFDRKIMNSGKLKELIEHDGIKGVTANPSIFEKAISASADYDDDIAIFSKQKGSNDDIFVSVAVKDIKRATDFFKSAYKESNGNDGFVSLEVSPHLAHDTAGTVKQARQLWKAVNRRNVMIKIPGTAEGLPAIRKCISEGININITLLFGLPRYKEVTDAYLSGLEDRIKANQPIDQIASVASFFLSRIDVLIDPLLDQKGLSEMKGEVAIASAKKAYEIYKEVFNSERFKKLEEKGAKRQRVLWASTGAKDPFFSDVKYVEALIGAETINTIPLETLEAFNDHGHPASRLEEDLDKATHLLTRLKEEGIDLDAITQKLEDQGIEKFNKAYDNLLEAIEKQKETVH